MWTVFAVLLPPAAYGVWLFGPKALAVILSCIAAAGVTEVVCCLLRGRPHTLADGSAAVTGLLLALTLPPGVHPGAAAVGAAFGIAVAKHVFGGLGYNIFNPALAGRAFLMLAFPVQLTTWDVPGTWRAGADALTGATPLALLRPEGGAAQAALPSLKALFLGTVGGCIGETCVPLLLLGGLLLIALKYVNWRVPTSILGVVAVAAAAFHLASPERFAGSALYHLFAGGLFIGAFFMATDMVTSPVTRGGQWVYGAAIGLVVALIRLIGGYPEGVMFSILLANALVPLIDRLTHPSPFGARAAAPAAGGSRG